MASSFCGFDVAAIVYGEEDVGRVFERGEGGFQTHGVLGLEEHKRHAGSEEDYAGLWEFAEFFVFEVFFPKGDCLR